MSFSRERDRRILTGLYEPFREIVEIIYGVVRAELVTSVRDVDVFLSAGFRSHDLQWDHYQKGRMKRDGIWSIVDRNRVVTYATPADTPHCVTTEDDKPCAMAVDFALIENGHYLGDIDPLWAVLPATVGLVARGSIECGAFWDRPRDWPHIQLKGWKGLVDGGILKADG